MHAKILIQKSILKNAQLKRRLKYNTKMKVKLKRQATKPRIGLPFKFIIDMQLQSSHFDARQNFS